MLVLGTTVWEELLSFQCNRTLNGTQHRTAQTIVNYDKNVNGWNLHSNATFNNIYYKHGSSWYQSGRDKSPSSAAPAGPCHWCWDLEEGTGKTRGRGETEESGAPVAALERGPGQTHRRGLRGRRGCAWEAWDWGGAWLWLWLCCRMFRHSPRQLSVAADVALSSSRSWSRQERGPLVGRESMDWTRFFCWPSAWDITCVQQWCTVLK